MKNQCDICNQKIEEHLLRQGKKLCFSCLTEEASASGAVSTFNLKEKPVQAPCAICEIIISGHDLFPSPWGYICRQCRDFCESQTGMSWELVKLAAQKEWLVKANSRILGPYTFDEVAIRLSDHQIVSLDEVSKPLSRWKLLRDEETFRPVLNEIKNKKVRKTEVAGESTVSATAPEEEEDLQSQTATLDIPLEYAPFSQSDKLLDGLSKKSREIDKVESHQKKSNTPLEGVAKSRDLLRSYAFKEDPRIIREFKKAAQQKTWLALLIFVAVGIFAAIKLTQPREGGQSGRSHSFEELMQMALKTEKTGDYEKALSLFSEARTIKPNDPELLLHLAPLTLLYDRQMIQAQRMFKEILDTEKGANYQKAAYLGLGLIALDSHELDNSQDFFLKALSLDSDYIPAVANLGVVAFYKNEYELARSYLLKALDRGGPEGAVVITLADLNVADSDSQAGRRRLYETHSTLDAYLNLERDYQQEVLIEDSRVLTLIGKTTEAGKKIEALLDIDPEQSDLHVRDWGIYRGRASWGLLLETLKKSVSELTPSPRLTAAIGLAMYRGHEKLDGAQSVELALSQSPKDPLLMALAGWVEIKLGRREQGVLNIKEASLMPDKLRLPHILQARLCQEDKDFECAKRHWNIVYSYDPRSVEAMHGLAWVEWNRRNFDGARSWLRQGQAMDPTYIPLLSLSQEMQMSQQPDSGHSGG